MKKVVDEGTPSKLPSIVGHLSELVTTFDDDRRACLVWLYWVGISHLSLTVLVDDLLKTDVAPQFDCHEPGGALTIALTCPTVHLLIAVTPSFCILKQDGASGRGWWGIRIVGVGSDDDDNDGDQQSDKVARRTCPPWSVSVSPPPIVGHARELIVQIIKKVTMTFGRSK